MSSIHAAHQVPPYVSASAAPPPSLPAGGRTALRVVLVAVAALVTLGALGSLSVLAFGLGNSRIVTDTWALPASVRSLTIETGDVLGVVRLTTDADATEPRVDLRMVTSDDGVQLAVANDAAGSRVTLRDSVSGYLRWTHAAEIEVILPPGVARGLSVTVNQRTGSLSADADLDQLVAKTDDGDITLGGSARRVEINVHHGDISTSTPIAVTESFTAKTGSGDISVEFRAAPRTTEAVADGDVTVGLPGPGPYRVNAQSEGPDRETTVRVPQTADPRAPMVTAHSKGANVTVTELR